MRSLHEADVRQAALAIGLPQEWSDRLLAQLSGSDAPVARFEGAHLLYYFGALLIIGASGWFITASWDTLPGLILFGVGAFYLLVLGAAAHALSRSPATFIPGGVLMTAAVCMTPLMIYGLERQLGWWPAGDPGGYSRFHPWIHGSWVLMEAVTVLMAGVALRLVRFPFITAPAAYALWYMSMDATQLLFHTEITFHQECWVSIAFGAAMLLVGFFAESRTTEDFSFWFYLFGLLALCGGLSLLGDGTQLGKLGLLRHSHGADRHRTAAAAPHLCSVWRHRRLYLPGR